MNFVRNNLASEGTALSGIRVQFDNLQNVNILSGQELQLAIRKVHYINLILVKYSVN